MNEGKRHVAARKHRTTSEHVCVSETDGPWPGHIHSARLVTTHSGNVTAVLERHLIAIRQRARRSALPANLHLCVDIAQVHSSARVY